MSGIALFVPNDQMYRQAEEILRETENHVSLLKKIDSEHAVEEARQAISAGANIIIARGRQAIEIQRHTYVPVAEITMTAQELGLLVVRAKEILSKEHPRIAVFGWGNMLCDTTYFEQLYHVEIVKHIFKEEEEWRTTVTRVMEDNIDFVLGGKMALEAASQAGVPALFLSSTGESIRVALKNAESLYYMSEIEQHNYAQFSTVLDSSYSGIIKIGANSHILVMNRAMEQIVNRKSDQVLGQSVTQLLPGLSETELGKVLSGESESYSTFLTIHDQSIVVVVEPIVVAGIVEGAILSSNRLKRLESDDKSIMSEQYLRGYVAFGTFEDIEKNMKGMKKVVERAKLYAQSSSLMLIEALSGPELDAVCQGIHNYSMRKNGPFLMVNLAGTTEDQQMKTLFGGYAEDRKTWIPGVLEEANRGTLVLQGIDKLTLPMQYMFVKTIRSKRLPKNGFEDARMIDTRVIACTAKNLTERRGSGFMRTDLYYMLKSLRLRIPTLKERHEDVEYLLNLYMKKYMDQYSRYHIWTAGAKRMLLEYPWEGNSIQLETFCERMILTARKRVLTEDYIEELMEELYNQDESIWDTQLMETETEEEPEDLMEKLIKDTLAKYNGSRVMTAKALNMSTTTLWRKIKKYGLDE